MSTIKILAGALALFSLFRLDAAQAADRDLTSPGPRQRQSRLARIVRECGAAGETFAVGSASAGVAARIIIHALHCMAPMGHTAAETIGQHTATALRRSVINISMSFRSEALWLEKFDSSPYQALTRL